MTLKQFRISLLKSLLEWVRRLMLLCLSSLHRTATMGGKYGQSIFKLAHYLTSTFITPWKKFQSNSFSRFSINRLPPPSEDMWPNEKLLLTFNWFSHKQKKWASSCGREVIYIKLTCKPYSPIQVRTSVEQFERLQEVVEKIYHDTVEHFFVTG